MFKTMTLALAGLGLTLAACGGSSAARGADADTVADRSRSVAAEVTTTEPPTISGGPPRHHRRSTIHHSGDSRWSRPPAPTTTAPPPPPPPPPPTEPNYLGATQFVESFVAAGQPDLLGGACLIVRTQPEMVQQHMRDSLSQSPDIHEKAAEYRMPADQFVDMIVVAYGNRLVSECG